MYDNKTSIELARDYALRGCKEPSFQAIKIPNGKVYECANLAIIPWYIWILLKFKKAKAVADIFELKEEKHIYVSYAKRLFGEIYITKNEHYINGKLIYREKLHRVEKGIRGFSAKTWTDELI